MSNSESAHLNIDAQSGHHGEKNNLVPSNKVPLGDPNSVPVADLVNANSQVAIDVNYLSDLEKMQSIRTVKLTNNEAKYEAMIAGFELAKSIWAEVIEAKYDSLLVVNQIKTFEVKKERIPRYLDKLQVTLYQLREWTLQHVPRDQNSEADALANLGSSVDSDEFSSGAVVQLMNSVIEEGHAEVNSTSLIWDWTNKYIDYLKTGKFSSDPEESRAMRTKVAKFSLVKRALFRRTFFGPLDRCLGPAEIEYAMREVHEGTCGNHSRVESLVRKLIRADYYYYWTEMENDVKDFVQK
ncbi:uncharacterized protein [Nicotiana tomentosiformis]|uniref:uncharacterized protein n=1 Tax=Nicotiana tomentosiformis TaxID=4098 RepID=UPI00388C9538